MAISKEEKEKLISECRICDIDLKNGFTPEANKIAECGLRPVNYGRINQIVKQEKSKGGDAFFRTWKTICILWKSYFSKKDKQGDGKKYITRTKLGEVKDFEKQIVKTYQQNYTDYNMLDTNLKGLEKKFRGGDERDRRKLQRIKDRELNKAKDEGASGVAAVERMRARMSEERGDGKTGDNVNTNKLKEAMTKCFSELHTKYASLMNSAMERARKEVSDKFLTEVKNIADNYTTQVNEIKQGSLALRTSARNYLKKLATSKTMSELNESLGGGVNGQNNTDLDKLFDTIKINGKQDSRTSLRKSIVSLFGQGV